MKHIDHKMLASLHEQHKRPLIESSEHITDGIREGDWQLFVQYIQTPDAFRHSPEREGCTYDEYFDQVCKIVGWQVIVAIGLMENGMTDILAFKAKRGVPVKTPMMGF